MRRGMLIVLLLGLLAVVAAPLATAVAQTCGEIDNDPWGLLSISDATAFAHYMTDLDYPAPPGIDNGDVDGDPGLSPGDLTYMLFFYTLGGPLPCQGPEPSSPMYAGSIQLVAVDGLIDSNTVAAGRQLKFYFRCSNPTDQPIYSMTNGFAVTSPDGAAFRSVDGEVAGTLAGLGGFGNMLLYGAPATPDNLGFTAFCPSHPILDPGASNASFVITIEPLSVDYVGKTLVIDSTTFGHFGYWQWYVDGTTPVIPAWGGPYTFTIGAPNYVAGDVNNSGSVNVADVTTLIDYLFKGGTEPAIMDACDVNGDCSGPNIADLTYLVAYLFQSGAEPLLSCSMVAKAAPGVIDGIQIGTTIDNDRTVISINSPIDLRGVQLELAGTTGDIATSLLNGNFELFQGNRGGTTRIGLLDMQGTEVIASGSHRLVELPGRHEVVSAIASDLSHQAHQAALVNGAVAMPSEYALNQNYPNPFNPNTTISFNLPQAERVRLDIYNVTGQRVATLVDGPMEAGLHTVPFEADHLSSGVYLYRLTAGDYTATKKMLLLK